MVNAIADRRPIMVGIKLYQSFYTASYATGSNRGVVPMPSGYLTGRTDLLIRTSDINENEVGGHAVCLCGYNDATERFTFVNSWGTSVGNNGLYTIPYEYMTDPFLSFQMYVV